MSDEQFTYGPTARVDVYCIGMHRRYSEEVTMIGARLGLAGMMIVGLIGCTPCVSQPQSTGPSESGTQPFAKKQQVSQPVQPAGLSESGTQSLAKKQQVSQPVQSAGLSNGGTKVISMGERSETPSDSPVLIVTVQSREHSVKIYSGDWYTVEDSEGILVAELVTEDEFKRILPEVFDHVREALADDAWAGHHITKNRSLPPIEQIQGIKFTQSTGLTSKP